MRVANGTLLCPCEKRRSVKPSRIRFPKWSQSCAECKKLHCCHERYKRAHFLRFVTHIFAWKNSIHTIRDVGATVRVSYMLEVSMRCLNRLIHFLWDACGALVRRVHSKKATICFFVEHIISLALMHIYSVNKNVSFYTLQLGKVPRSMRFERGASHRIYIWEFIVKI
jgi:hypothetical protein